MTEILRTNGFSISNWRDFDPEQAAHRQDAYHMYTYVGRQASNTTHHHPQGDVAVLYAFTSPKDPDIQGDQTKRYIVIVDQWSGKAIRVGLPEIEEYTKKKEELTEREDPESERAVRARKINPDGIRPDGEEYGTD